MNDSTDYNLSLSEDADFLATLISCGELNDWQLQAAIRKIASLDPKTRTTIWLTLREDMPEQEYDALHKLYTEHCLKHGWAVGRGEIR